MNTNSISAYVAPIGDQPPPTCYLSGDIPVIEFGRFPAEASITLGNHDDPIGYLRRFAAELADFADVVEQAQAVTA